MEKCQKSYDIMGEVNLDSKESVMMAKCLKFKYDIYIVVYLCATFLASQTNPNGYSISTTNSSDPLNVRFTS